MRLNAVGMKTAVLPITWAGVNAPLPFTETVKFGLPPQLATKTCDFLAFTGSADAACAKAAKTIAKSAITVVTRRSIVPPLE